MLDHDFDVGSKNRLTPRDLDRFAADTVFDKVARAVCRAEVLPRKELYESWEVARRLHRRLRRRRRRRVVDLCCGHGLLGALLLILDSELDSGQGSDRAPPPSSSSLLQELHRDFSFSYDVVAGDIDDVVVSREDVVVSAHA